MITFYYHDTSVVIDELKASTHLEELTALEGCLLSEVNIVFCSDDYLFELNKTYLLHDYFTDILTFDYSQDNELCGELYISLDRILDNSRRFDVSINQELTRVIIHGFLHLCGYKDKTKEQKADMSIKEDHYLTCFGVF